MIETTIPEINITELMERVRAEAERPKAPPHRALSPAESSPQLPPVAMLPSAPAVWIPGPVRSRKDRVDSLVETAREKNEPHSKIPKFLLRFFRKQGGYNRAVAESVAVLSKTTDDLTRRLGEVSTCLGQFNSWLLALHEQSDADANWMKAAAPGVSMFARHEEELRQMRSELESARSTLDLLSADSVKREDIDRKITALEERDETLGKQITTAEERARDQFAALNARAAETGELARELSGRVALLVQELERIGGETQTLAAGSRALESSVAQGALAARDRHDGMRRDVDQAAEHLRNLQGQTDHLGTHVHNLGERVTGIVSDSVFVKGELSEYGLLLHRLLAKEFQGPAAAKKSAASKADALGLDTFYFNFENRFRGSRDEIKSRVAFYLPFIRSAGAGVARSPVLDVGCGRGEWLELLKEHKLEGRGVDLNTTMAAHCKARGLKVRLADAVEHLRSLRANSHGAITGFHIIEHIAFETLMQLFGEVRRVLKPGGVAIFESPNCKNLMVGACNFNIDPTHRNPVFPETAEFMLASHGFEKIRIEYLSPVSEPSFHGSTPELAKIKELLYGPQDFGVIAYKPKKR